MLDHKATTFKCQIIYDYHMPDHIAMLVNCQIIYDYHMLDHISMTVKFRIINIIWPSLVRSYMTATCWSCMNVTSQIVYGFNMSDYAWFSHVRSPMTFTLQFIHGFRMSDNIDILYNEVTWSFILIISRHMKHALLRKKSLCFRISAERL